MNDDSDDVDPEPLPTVEDIIAIHDRLEEAYDLKHTGAMTAAPRLTIKDDVLSNAQEYDDPHHRAAALLWNLISTHVFEDANRRTAWTATLEYLDRHGVDPDLPEDEAARVVRRHGLFTVNELATWLETGKIDTERLPED
jgi:death-on-curing protein